MSSPTRLVASAAALGLLVAVLGWGWEYARFGPTPAAAEARLERNVQQQIADDSDQLETLGASVAAESQLISDAANSRDQLPTLFGRLMELTAPHGDRASATVYVPVGSPSGGYLVLAWSDGPAGTIAPVRLAGPAALFVARGVSGTRLVWVQPVEANGRRIAVAATEIALGAVNQNGTSTLETSFGSVTIIPPYVGVGEGAPGVTTFGIDGPTGAQLLQVQFAVGDLAGRREGFRRRTEALAILPLALALLIFVDPLIARRRRTRTIAPWLGWSVFAAADVAGSAALCAGLVVWLGTPAAASALLAIGALGIVAIVPGGLWWRPSPRRVPTEAPVRFVIDHLVGGIVLAAASVAISRLLAATITPATLETWSFVLFPFDAMSTLSLIRVLAISLAIIWSTAAILAAIALRWRVRFSRPASAVALGLWLAPSLAIITAGHPAWSPPPLGSSALACAIGLFGVGAGAVRRHYRQSTQSMHLVLGLLAVFVPLMAVYPFMASAEDHATRAIIEDVYAPATANRPQALAAALADAEEAIDGQIPQLLSGLPQLSAAPRGTGSSNTAFEVWRQTSLSESRVISDVEVYGADRNLVSRFALDLPQYDRANIQHWPGSSCTWSVFGEVATFGTEDRAVLHAERGLCDAAGHLMGGIVLHVAPRDYRALPFLSSANPYYQMLGVAGRPVTGSHLADLQVAVYGWSFEPLFASGNVAWSIPADLFLRLYDPGTPFWTTLSTGGRTYHVYFSETRAGIYALGYPTPSLIEHAERVAEIGVIATGLFILIQIVLTARAALLERPTGPLRALYSEIRTSFHRKLFLSFVLVSVVPVLLFALAFATYMTGRFRDDVESDANSVVAVAHRVFEELSAAAERPDVAPPLSDDMMVWIAQVIDQDVNVFRGAELVATSQPELLDSGKLPKRTPAAVYRAIVLDRLPTFVTEDRLGSAQYLVAAAPVTALGRDTVLSVPLALRQRELDREIDDLKRGVLVGSVLVVLFAAGLGASIARRVSDPVARLTKATRQIAAGHLDVRIAADTADELRRLVDDFNSMTETLRTQRAALARTNQLKAWNEMARQVAHEIKNPLTPIQLAAEHLQRVHEDQHRPLGPVFDQCLRTILGQVRLLRQIASEFSNFASDPTPRPEVVAVGPLLDGIVDSYRLGLSSRVGFEVDVPAEVSAVWVDRTLLARALTNLVENAVQAMPSGGRLTLTAREARGWVALTVADTGVGMDAASLARAFEPYFSTKTGGSGLGLANAKRNIERLGGSIAITSEAGVGTTLTITLPAAVSPPVATATEAVPIR